MALSGFSSLALAAILTISSGLAQAMPEGRGGDRGHGPGYGWPGHGGGHGGSGGGHGGPGYPPGPTYPNPYPVPPTPPTPPAPIPPYGNDRQASAFIGRRIFNQRISLLQILNLQQYNGYSVQNVTIGARGYQAQVALLINGVLQGAVTSPAGIISLTPSFGGVLGRDIGSIDLDIRGVVDLDTVSVTLRACGNNGPGNGGPIGQQIIVPLQIPAQRLFSGSRIELLSAIDLRNYVGFRIAAVEVSGRAGFNSAALEVVLNSFSSLGTVNLSPFAQAYSIYTNNLVIGYNLNSLSLNSRGDVDLNSVALRLVR